jgi:hypothetical protein
MKPQRSRINTLTTSTQPENANVNHIETSPAISRPIATRYVTPTSQRGISPVLSQIAASDIMNTAAILTA